MRPTRHGATWPTEANFAGTTTYYRLPSSSSFILPMVQHHSFSYSESHTTEKQEHTT